MVCAMAGWRSEGETEGVDVSEGAVSRAELVSLSPEPWPSLSLSKLPSATSSCVGVLRNRRPAVSARLAMSGREMDNFLLFRKLAGGGLASSLIMLSDSSSFCVSPLLSSTSMYTVDSRGVASGVSSDTSATSPLRELDDCSEITDKFRGIPLTPRWVVAGSVRMLCMQGGERRGDLSSIHGMSAMQLNEWTKCVQYTKATHFS